jgi:phosphomannomutase
MNKFIFDVDGTLTPSRGMIDTEYKDYFLSFCQDNEVYLVTGSDREKTIEQLGESIYNSAAMVFNCSGNDVWKGRQHIYTNPWKMSAAVVDHLTSVGLASQCPEKTGNHIESRPGSINFSTVGRKANCVQRAAYIEFDNRTHEREHIVKTFNNCFGTTDNCTALIGGETGIDISATGHDKRQVLEKIKFTPRKDKLFFFGDKTTPGGNDYPLAFEIKTREVGTVVSVKKWRDTFETLSYYQEAKIAK